MKKLVVVMLTVTLIIVSVGLGVHVMNREAHAIDLSVRFTVNWGMWIPVYNVGATAQLIGSDGNPIGQPIPLASNAAFTEYTGVFNDVPSYATDVLFVWDGDDLDWGIVGGAPIANPNGEEISLNWSGETWLPVWCSMNW